MLKYVAGTAGASKRMLFAGAEAHQEGSRWSHNKDQLSNKPQAEGCSRCAPACHRQRGERASPGWFCQRRLQRSVLPSLLSSLACKLHGIFALAVACCKEWRCMWQEYVSG